MTLTPPDAIVGRAADLEQLNALLRTHRFVLLCCPPGIGARRLAWELAELWKTQRQSSNGRVIELRVGCDPEPEAVSAQDLLILKEIEWQPLPAFLGSAGAVIAISKRWRTELGWVSYALAPLTRTQSMDLFRGRALRFAPNASLAAQHVDELCALLGDRPAYLCAAAALLGALSVTTMVTYLQQGHSLSLLSTFAPSGPPDGLTSGDWEIVQLLSVHRGLIPFSAIQEALPVGSRSALLLTLHRLVDGYALERVTDSNYRIPDVVRAEAQRALAVSNPNLQRALGAWRSFWLNHIVAPNANDLPCRSGWGPDASELIRELQAEGQYILVAQIAARLRLPLAASENADDLMGWLERYRILGEIDGARTVTVSPDAEAALAMCALHWGCGHVMSVIDWSVVGDRVIALQTEGCVVSEAQTTYAARLAKRFALYREAAQAISATNRPPVADPRWIDLLEDDDPELRMLAQHVVGCSLDVVHGSRAAMQALVEFSAHRSPAHVEALLHALTVQSQAMKRSWHVQHALNYTLAAREWRKDLPKTIGIIERELIAAAVVHAPTLDANERELAQALLTGGTNKQLAKHLRVNESTIRNRLQKLFKRLGCRNRSELVRWILEHQ